MDENNVITDQPIVFDAVHGTLGRVSTDARMAWAKGCSFGE